MLRIFQILIAIVFLFHAFQLYGQPEGGQSNNRRAQRAFDRALEAYRLVDYDLALEETDRALSRDPDFLNALILKAEVLIILDDTDQNIETFQRIIDLEAEEVYPEAYYYIGLSQYTSGMYPEARNSFESFLTVVNRNAKLSEKANGYLASCRFAIEAIKNPVPYDPVNLGSGVNSSDAEYSPSITADGETMVFTRRSRLKNSGSPNHVRETENFFISHFDGDEWGRAMDVGSPINTSGNEGAQSLSVDGRELFFTACNRADGLGSCDIYYTQRKGDHWHQPQNLGAAVNSAYWDSQPSISSDGRMLYFSSNRPGGQGDVDIWVAFRNEEGIWDGVQNLGEVINTPGRDMSPFIHPDNHTLYFVSDGHLGMGGLDLFYSRRHDQTSWAEAVNLGYPVNTHADEFSLIVGNSGQKAYFATDKAGGYGRMDIYEFELYEGARPQPMTYMKGHVFDDETGEALPASFELIDLETGNTLQQAHSDPIMGDFLVVIPLKVSLALNVSSPGYLFFSEHFSIQDAYGISDPYLMNIAMQAVRSGESVVLKNVFFDTGSFKLRPESKAELDRLSAFLDNNTTIKVEISGHTDNIGTYDDNLDLSENRAASVAEYLMGKGVDPGRISYKGYADTRPVDTNDTPEGRANNRRTEFTIIEH